MRGALRSLISVALVLAAGAASAQQSTNFFAGRTIRIIVGSTTGGYYDAAARTVARFLGDHIPGHPAIVVQNQPDASGAAIGERLADSYDRDGTVIVAMSQAVPQLALVGDPSIRFDPLKLTWLGSLTSYKDDGYLMTVKTSNWAKTWRDVVGSQKPLFLGGTREGSTNIIFAELAHDVLKMNLQIIRGFPGASEIWLAMDRGEVEGQMLSISAILVGRPQQWADKQLRPLVGFGLRGRLKEWPDVPDALELVKDPADRELVEFAELPFFMAAPFVAPPGLPPERAAVLRRAFMDMANDPVFQAELKKAGILPSPIDGDAVQALLQKAADTPIDVRRRFGALLTEK